MLRRALRLQDAEAEYRAAKALYERTLHAGAQSADASACVDGDAGASAADEEWLAALPAREAQPDDSEAHPASPGGSADGRDGRDKGAKLRGLVGKFWVGWGAPAGAAEPAAGAAADAGKSGERLVQERRRSKLHSWLHRTSAHASSGRGAAEGGGCTGGDACGARWAAVFSREQWAEAILQQVRPGGAHPALCRLRAGPCVPGLVVQAEATCARSARGSSLWHLRLAYASVRSAAAIATQRRSARPYGGALRAQVVQRLAMLLLDIGGLEVPLLAQQFPLGSAKRAAHPPRPLPDGLAPKPCGPPSSSLTPGRGTAGRVGTGCGSAASAHGRAQASAGAGDEAARSLWTEGRALAHSSVQLHQLLMGEVRAWRANAVPRRGGYWAAGRPRRSKGLACAGMRSTTSVCVCVCGRGWRAYVCAAPHVLRGCVLAPREARRQAR